VDLLGRDSAKQQIAGTGAGNRDEEVADLLAELSLVRSSEPVIGRDLMGRDLEDRDGQPGTIEPLLPVPALRSEWRPDKSTGPLDHILRAHAPG
jgi:hypothetical protein